MCCFSQPVVRVSDTQIFAHLAAGGRQTLVYRMNVEAKQSLAMVLPLPLATPASETAVHFVDLHGYGDFFDDLATGFPEPQSKGVRGPVAAAAVIGAEKLAIVSVGSFEASFVPTIGDFQRLDERFRLPADAWSQLPQYKTWGFAVFKLKDGRQPSHPMAFDFPTASKRAFFPTVHIHDGKVHAQAEFDHTLYCQVSGNGRDGQHTGLHGWRESPQPAGMFMNKKRALGLIEPEHHVFRQRITGMLKNEDVYV